MTEAEKMEQVRTEIKIYTEYKHGQEMIHQKPMGLTAFLKSKLYTKRKDKAMGKKWEKFKEWMNSVPDCPSCHGTGEPKSIGEFVFWKGQEIYVCYQCKGSGKV